MEEILACFPVNDGKVFIHLTDEMAKWKYVLLVGLTSTGKQVPFRKIIVGKRKEWQFDVPPYETFKEICVIPTKLFYHEPRLFSVNPFDPLEGRDKREHDNRIPIVFIHGLWRAELSPPDPQYGRWLYKEKFETFINYINALKPLNNKIKIYAYVYPSHYASLEEHVDNLIALMKVSKTLSSTPPILIGHSFGGLVARETALRYPVRSVVTIATPHRGTPIIDYMYMKYREFKKLWGNMRELMIGLYRIREMLFYSGAFVVSPAHDVLLWQKPYVYNFSVPLYVVSPWMDIEVTPEDLENMLREASKDPNVVGSYLFAARVMAFMGSTRGYSAWKNNDGAVPIDSSRDGIEGNNVVKLPHIMGDHETPLLAVDYFIEHILPKIIA